MTNAPDKPGASGLASPSDPGWQSLGDFHGDAVYVKADADSDDKAAAMNGHGNVYGSCGHKTGSCRCTHKSAVRRFRNEPCVACGGKNPMSLSSDVAHSYSSTHVELPKEMADRIKAVGATIPPEDLAEEGCEANPHVTVKYGLNSDSPAAVKDAIKGEMPARFRLGHTKVFPATADRPSDVLVAGVHSEDLHRLHHLVSGSAPHVDTHAGYTPHATIAYLKPGRGEKYAGRSDLAGMEGMADEVVHSNKAGEETRIPLAGKVRHVLSLSSDGGTFILRLADASEGKSLPLGLEGYPKTDDAGQTIHYRRVLIARCGEWFHCGSGDPLNITPDRADEWVRNVTALAAAGRQPFIPVRHVFDNASAAENLGRVLRLERTGKDVYAVIALHGDDALKVAARNGRSVGIIRNARDVNGKVYPGEWLHHLALVPNPALPDLGGNMKIAASADGPARDVPVYDFVGNTPAAAPNRPNRSYRMKPEIAQQVRAKLGFGADVPDDQLDDKAAEKALALSADALTLITERDTLKASVTALTTERDEAKSQLDAKGREVLALSANDPTKLDLITLGIVSDGIFSRRDLAVRHGAVSEAEAKGLDAILSEADGTPNRIALSVTGTGKERRPAAVKIWDWVMSLGANGIRTGTAKPPGAIEAQRIALDAGGAEADKPNADDVAYLRKLNSIPVPAAR